MTNRTRTTHWTSAIILLVLMLSACTQQTPAPTEPPQLSTPTSDPVAVTQTFQAIITSAQETLVADLTAQAPPTATAQPTNTPIVITATVAGTAATQQATTALPTATSQPGQQATSTSAPVVTSTPALSTCQIVSQNPAFGQDFSPGEDLDLRWTVRNTSGSTWDQGETDYVFVSGDEIHRQAAYDFRETVESNDEVDIIVDALAPTQPGRYATTWAIVRGGQRVCLMSATIDVVE